MVAHLAINWFEPSGTPPNRTSPYALLAALTAERLVGANPIESVVDLVKACWAYRVSKLTFHPPGPQQTMDTVRDPRMAKILQRSQELTEVVNGMADTQSPVGMGPQYVQGLAKVVAIDAWASLFLASLTVETDDQWQQEVYDTTLAALDDAKQFFERAEGFFGERPFPTTVPNTADSDLVELAIEHAILNGHLTAARELAAWATKAMPSAPSLKALSELIQAPGIRIVAESGPQLSSSEDWLAANEGNFKGLWVVVCDGKLLRSGATFSDAQSGGIPTGALVTRVL